MTRSRFNFLQCDGCVIKKTFVWDHFVSKMKKVNLWRWKKLNVHKPEAIKIKSRSTLGKTLEINIIKLKHNFCSLKYTLVHYHVNILYYVTVNANQSCKSGRAFQVGFGLKVDKILGLIRAWGVFFVFFVLDAQKYNQINLEHC